MSFLFLLLASYYTYIIDEHRHKILAVLVFFYDHASNHFISGFTPRNKYYTTMEYDECIVIFFKVCQHANKSL